MRHGHFPGDSVMRQGRFKNLTRELGTPIQSPTHQMSTNGCPYYVTDLRLSGIALKILKIQEEESLIEREMK